MLRLRIALAITLLAILLTLPPATDYESYIDILSHTSMTLKGQAPHADVAQDIYGFRALMTNKDPYALLGPALKTIGVEWKANFSSHPPSYRIPGCCSGGVPTLADFIHGMGMAYAHLLMLKRTDRQWIYMGRFDTTDCRSIVLASHCHFFRSNNHCVVVWFGYGI